jgi:hypothetical protein
MWNPSLAGSVVRKRLTGKLTQDFCLNFPPVRRFDSPCEVVLTDLDVRLGNLGGSWLHRVSPIKPIRQFCQNSVNYQTLFGRQDAGIPPIALSSAELRQKYVPLHFHDHSETVNDFDGF